MYYIRTGRLLGVRTKVHLPRLRAKEHLPRERQEVAGDPPPAVGTKAAKIGAHDRRGGSGPRDVFWCEHTKDVFWCERSEDVLWSEHPEDDLDI